MAFIKIKGRADPLTVDDTLARSIKERKFGVDGRVTKAESTELLDIVHAGGEWSGEYGRISEVDIGKKQETNANLEAEKQRDREALEKWYAMSPKVKAQGVEWFKLCYSGRTGDYTWQPDPELLAKVIAFQEEFYTTMKRTRMIPSDAYGDLLPPKTRVGTLAQKMRVPAEPSVSSSSAGQPIF